MGRTALYRNQQELQRRLREVPDAPGVYRFYDARTEIVYVGKSIHLRDRVRSYFSGRPATTKLRRMRQEIVELDWEETGSELEALLLESRLIKRHQPRFNVMLRGFVPLPYVRVDREDLYPRLEITRSPERDGASYFGPFHSQSSLEAAVRALADSLRLRDCEPPGERLVGYRPCYRYEFGTCSGPCLGEITPDAYRQDVETACEVFQGREQTALDMLRQKMARAAERLQFELAARFRDAARHIEGVAGRQQALLSAVQELSLVAVCPSARNNALCLFVFRNGRLVLQEEAGLALLLDERGLERLAQRLAAAAGPLPGEESVRLDAALLDEVQIISSWMQQKTREGEYWEYPRQESSEAAAALLEEWLVNLVARIVPAGQPELGEEAA